MGIYEKSSADLSEELSGAQDVIAFLGNANFGNYLRS